MKICFPAENLDAMDSRVYEAFGFAPGFVVFDTESESVEQINNGGRHHEHGMCRPLKALVGRALDAVAVGGIGMGALLKLKAQGIKVFRAEPGTVGRNIALILDEGLPEFDPGFTCHGHTGGGCARWTGPGDR
jgi:predicted Fe-Mo cluster-binding NifX family protein